MSSIHYGVTNLTFNEDNDSTKYLLTDAGEVKDFGFPTYMGDMGIMYPVEDVQLTSQ